MKALGIWGGIAGLAGLSGSVISGTLTDLAPWRWVSYINVPVALHVDSFYLGTIMPGMIAVGLSSGLCLPAVFIAALHEVTAQDSSLAAGGQNAMQAVGGALGLACLVAFALRHATGLIGDRVAPNFAATQGYVLALRIAGVLLTVGGIFILIFLEHVAARPPSLVKEVIPAAPTSQGE